MFNQDVMESNYEASYTMHQILNKKKLLKHTTRIKHETLNVSFSSKREFISLGYLLQRLNDNLPWPSVRFSAACACGSSGSP